MSEHTEKTNEGPAVSTDNEHQEEEEAEYGEEEDLEDSDAYLNNHDLIGVDGIIRAQRNEIEKKKVRSKTFLHLFSSVGTAN